LVLDTLSRNATAQPAITALRTRLMAEHLGVSPDEVSQTFESTGSLIDTITQLSKPGKTLNLLKFEQPGDIETFIADNEILDPEHPDAFFEALDKRGLWKKWREKLGHRAPAVAAGH
jgi:hypothetical protein